jgi:hypothetical protein
MQSCTATVTHSYLKTSVFILYYSRCSFFISSFLSFSLPSSHELFHIFISKHDCTPLHFYKGCIQSNQQLAHSRLMHSIHCGSTKFSYQVLERRPARDFNRLCRTAKHKKFEGTEHSTCIYKSLS